MTERLYTANEVAKMLSMTRHWVADHHHRDAALTPAFVTTRGERTAHLWTATQLDAWRAYHAGATFIPRGHGSDRYSNHLAINKVGNQTVTWKLWWRNTCDGFEWWFSTPQGWYICDDAFIQWRLWPGGMTRPQDYHYYCVNGNVTQMSSVAAKLRSAEQLRQRLERTDR